MIRKPASAFLIALYLTVTLTLEEGVHLYNHPQGWPPDNLSLRHDPGCSPASTDPRVIRCPVDGYNSAIFMCSEVSCRFKEPSNGSQMVPSEERIWNIYMRKRSSQQVLQLEQKLQNGTLDDAFLRSEEHSGE